MTFLLICNILTGLFGLIVSVLPLYYIILQYHYTVPIQWNPFTPDTIGTTVSVLISGVSLFQGLILYTFICICGKTKCQDLRFEGVWSEGFHCTVMYHYTVPP